MLDEEIIAAQRLVKTDAYQISIGEIVNMYKDGELFINPDFQRLFRWNIGQKSKLIESILLGIPLPSIFVFEKDNSTWELIDGLQRISTILEFMGLLKEPGGENKVPPSALVGTKYLPSLNNAVWEKDERIEDIKINAQAEIVKSLQLAIRRARISVEILKRPSENNTKYDLFQRLNAGGTPANAQELRNCVIIMVSNEYYQFVKDVANSHDFLAVLSASEEQKERQRHMEYASRFLVLSHVPYDNKLDVEEFIDEGIIALAERGDIELHRSVFVRTFDLLNRSFGGDAFRRYTNGQHSGRVSLAAFECIAVGLGKNIESISKKSDPVGFVHERIRLFWADENLKDFFTPGLRGTTRIQRTIPFGLSWFKDE